MYSLIYSRHPFFSPALFATPHPYPSATRALYKQHPSENQASISCKVSGWREHPDSQRIGFWSPSRLHRGIASEAAGEKVQTASVPSSESLRDLLAATFLLPLAFLWQTPRPINKATRVYRRDGGRQIQKGKAQEKIKGVRIKPHRQHPVALC